MSHFSLFCIEEYTIKQGSNWLSFFILNTTYNQHNGRSFWRLCRPLNIDFVDVLCVTFSDVFSATFGVCLTSNLTTFGDSYRRLATLGRPLHNL